jgi:hypothetical protein
MTGILACEKAACMALAVQTVPAAPPGGVPATGFMSGADQARRPTVCLGREGKEIGSTVLAGKRIFHIGSAR